MSDNLKKLVEENHVVLGFPPAASPAGTEDYVSMKAWNHISIIIQQDNATSVTGATVTVKQATTVAAAGEKALSFTTYYANEDTATSDTFVKTTATSNTFDTVATNNLNALYVIEINAADLDVANNFDCIRVDVTGNANCVLSCVYVLGGGRFLGGLPRVSAITD